MKRLFSVLLSVTLILTMLSGITVFADVEDAVEVDVVADVIIDGATVSYWNNAKCDGSYLYNLGNDGTDGNVVEEVYSYWVSFNNSAKTFSISNPSSTPFDVETIVFPYQVTYNGTTYTFNGVFTSTYFLTGGSSSATSVVKNIYMAEGITNLGAGTNGGSFRNGKSVESVILPSTLTTMNSGNMFMSCTALKTIVLPAGLTNIPGQAFASSGITEITFPASITSIGDAVFYNATSLENVYFADGFKWPNNTIPSSMFRACAKLNNFEIPDYITSLGGTLTFSGCSAFTEITIPAGVTSIPNQGFSGCSSLTKVVVKGPVTEILSRAFLNAPLNEGIIFENKVAPAKFEALVFNTGSVKVYYPANGTGYTADAFTMNGTVSNAIHASTKFIPFGGHISALADDGANTTVTYSVADVYDNAALLATIALYDGDALVAVKSSVDAAGTDVTFENVTGADYAKIYVWNALAGAKPLYESFEYTVAQ